MFQNQVPVQHESALKTERMVEQREILLAWKSPQRYFKKLEKRSFVTLLVVVMLFMILLVLLKQYYFMAALAATVFLLYVLGTVPPPLVTNIVTNKGIEVGGDVYIWEVFKNFYFTVRDGQILVNVETTLRTPGKLIMLVNEEQKRDVYEILSKKLVYKDLRKQGRFSTILDGAWVDMLQNASEYE